MEDTRFSVSLHILTVLAFHEKGCQAHLANSDHLAEELKTHPVLVRRLLSRLVKAGILESKRGKQGGVSLKKTPAQISLKEVYLASVDRPQVKISKQPPNKNCPISTSMKKIFGELNEGMETTTLDYLKGISLADLTKKIKID